MNSFSVTDVFTVAHTPLMTPNGIKASSLKTSSIRCQLKVVLEHDNLLPCEAVGACDVIRCGIHFDESMREEN